MPIALEVMTKYKIKTKMLCKAWFQLNTLEVEIKAFFPALSFTVNYDFTHLQFPQVYNMNEYRTY